MASMAVGATQYEQHNSKLRYSFFLLSYAALESDAVINIPPTGMGRSSIPFPPFQRIKYRKNSKDQREKTKTIQLELTIRVQEWYSWWWAQVLGYGPTWRLRFLGCLMCQGEVQVVSGRKDRKDQPKKRKIRTLYRFSDINIPVLFWIARFLVPCAVQESGWWSEMQWPNFNCISSHLPVPKPYNKSPS